MYCSSSARISQFFAASYDVDDRYVMILRVSSIQLSWDGNGEVFAMTRLLICTLYSVSTVMYNNIPVFILRVRQGTPSQRKLKNKPQK